MSWLEDFRRIDEAVFTAVAETSTPQLDVAMRRVSDAANYSKLSIGIGAALAVGGGRRGRRAAAAGLVAVAVTSLTGNLIVKRIARRRRPDREAIDVPSERHVKMPSSRSFPSGHSAAAVAFASAVGSQLPVASAPLHALAGLVGYSRVHTGVHYPGDVLGGALIGAVIANATTAAFARLSSQQADDPLGDE
jgi:membrane-associated phospholipid phosphatase